MSIVNRDKIKDETIQNLRNNGYMVIIFGPEEMGPVADFSDIQDQAINYINELIEDQKDESIYGNWDIVVEDDLT